MLCNSRKYPSYIFMKTVGILGLQGCVKPHFKHLKDCKVNFLAIKNEKEILKCDAYILPGGESTTMLKLLDAFNIKNTLKKELTKKPFWGICAGSILIAKTVKNPIQESFNLMDITIVRNAYGRQNDSFKTHIEGYEVDFIRAPLIESVSKDTKIISVINDNPIWVIDYKNNFKMATTFHPELNEITPSPMHKFFCKNI